MSELTDFLLARIAEDEAVAARCSALPEWATPEAATAEHFKRWLPNRVLAECEAKRRIVAQYLGSGDALAKYSDPVKRLMGEAIHASHADALKPLALPYADHPDYDQTWRP